MSKHILLLLLLGLCAFTPARAQLNWQSKGPLYEDQYLTVEIEYAMGNNPCGTDGVVSQYRYHITKLQKTRGFYINWRFDYFTCDHQLKSHANSLRITRKTKIGYITPSNNQFSALRLVNNFNDVKVSGRLPVVSAYEPTSTVSLEPKAITGKFVIHRGESTTLSFTGGYLAPHDSWTWYEGDCGGKPVGTGTSLVVQPTHTTIYALRGEGQHPTACILVTINVPDANEPATGVAGKSQICMGEKNVPLTVMGGKLINGAKWLWYQDQCGGTPVAEGERIAVSPLRTTVYYVRAEGPGGQTTCQTYQLTVNAPSQPADQIDGLENVVYGDPLILSIYGKGLATNTQWVWYSGTGDHKIRLGAGNSWTVASVIETQTYSVRAEGPCSNSAFAFKTVRVVKKAKRLSSVVALQPTQFFINGGLVSNAPNHLSSIKNYVATIGGGKNIGWFLRAKVSGEQSKASYETAGLQIANYNIPGYYQYNSQTVSKRTAYTGGFYWGFPHVAVYIGAGYGTRELLYGIDQYSYGSTFTTGSDWVKNTAYSYTGAEVEGGLILKVSSFNLMGGLSTIQGKYTDYNLGLGFNF